ncbi:DUF1746 domain containing protein [Niveomyces insectorum RCEF 264]|uniref:DUF1746 domain containing protein n=1 Tax=Niveomyces insectorum RCEF 264 TaxID=1081102 RepID=A0A167WEA3_9HYPO|nr:DUF1746 domain containing protein [Niveomyces insectorum RCEF 264]
MNNDTNPGVAANSSQNGGIGSSYYVGGAIGSERRSSHARLRSDGRRRRRHGVRQSGEEHQPRRARRRSAPPISGDGSGAVTRKVRAGLTKKLQFLTELMKHLDMLVYAELCALYYMDCSFSRFFIRSVAQSLFLSPRSDDFFLATAAHKPHVFAVFVPNALCMLIHLLASLPQASEATRGYLHGGILIDFVGQKAPTSRAILLFLDLVILAVQCLMLAVHTEREKLRKLVGPLRGTQAISAAALARVAAATAAAERAHRGEPAAVLGSTVPTRTPPVAQQDHDAEERGVLRQREAGGDGPFAPQGAEGIELQPLSSSQAATLGREGGDDAQPPDTSLDLGEGALEEGQAPSLPSEAAADHVLDALSMGANISDFYIVHALRNASRDYQGAATQSLQTIGYAVTLARLAAERGARIRPDPRPQ